MLLTAEDEIQEVVEFAVETTELNQEVTWSWNRRLTSTLGRAYGRGKRIELSKPIWPVTDPEMRRETIVHEVCHVAAYLLFGGDLSNSHGWEWVMMMERCGYHNPQTKHRVDLRSIQNRNRHPVFCDCRVHMVTKGQLKKIRDRTHRFSCNKCMSIIREGS